MSGPLQRSPEDGASGLAFVLSFPRSGTTLLGQILAASPGVLLLEEKPVLALGAADFMETPDGFDRLAAIGEEELEPYRRDFWRRVRGFAGAPDGKFVVDQTAFNSIYLPLIGRLFPDARIVFAIRDPRDVVFSCFRRQFAPTPFTLDFHSLESAARFYDRTMRLADLWRARTGLRIVDIRYEDLVSDFDGQTRRLCDGVGIEWVEAMRDFHRASRDRTLSTRSAAQVRQGLTRDFVGTWRRYREQMAPVMPLLTPWVKRFDYPLE